MPEAQKQDVKADRYILYLTHKSLIIIIASASSRQRAFHSGYRRDMKEEMALLAFLIREMKEEREEAEGENPPTNANQARGNGKKKVTNTEHRGQ